MISPAGGPAAAGRRRRAHRDGQVRPRRRARRAPGRRGRQRRRDGALPRHGRRHGQARPRPSARGVPHHLLDVLDVTETASVAAYQRAARAVIEDLRAAGRTPVLVGGSGLYVQAVVDELEFPGTDAGAARRSWRPSWPTVGPAALHARLAAVDPAAAAAVLPSNGRRIVRALEVVALTGRPFPRPARAGGPPRYDAVLLGVDRPTGELDERVGPPRRADVRRRAGRRDPRAARPRPARGPDGVPGAGLPAGRRRARRRTVISATAAADTVRATRRFVRRQRSWFRRDRRITWLDPRPGPARPALAPRSDRLGRPSRPAMIRFAKGHGTENDFVVLPDPDGALDLTRRPGRRALRPPPRARRGRRAAGGPLGRAEGRRVPRRAAASSGSWTTATPTAASAEMCGNGVRVYARWLADAGWLPERPAPLRLGTRAGVREVRFTGDGRCRRRHGPGTRRPGVDRAGRRRARSPGRPWTSATRTWPASPTSRSTRST